MNYRGIIFDLDGTLADSFPAIHESLVLAMKGTGVSPWDFKDTKGHVGHGIEHLVECAVGGELKDKALEIFREDYGKNCQHRTPLLPGVAEVLPGLRTKGYLLAVATNKPLLFTNRILEHLGIRQHLDAVFGPDLVARPKPHPDMIMAIREQLQLTKEECVYLGDMPLDVETASQAGVGCMLVSTGAYSYSQLLEQVSVPVLKSLAELPDFLKSN